MPQLRGYRKRPTTLRFGCRRVSGPFTSHIAPLVQASPLHQNLPNQSAAVRNRHGTSGPIVNGEFRVDAQTLIDGRADIRCADGTVFDKSGLSVGSAANRAAANPGA